METEKKDMKNQVKIAILKPISMLRRDDVAIYKNRFAILDLEKWGKFIKISSELDFVLFVWLHRVWYRQARSFFRGFARLYRK